jgi:hypothetical protein
MRVRPAMRPHSPVQRPLAPMAHCRCTALSGVNPSPPLRSHCAATAPFPPLPRSCHHYAFPISATHKSASTMCHRPSSSLMLSSRSSPSVLTLWRPRCALSSICFIGLCQPLTPLPLPCVGTRLPCPCCRRPHHGGCCLSSLPMVPVPSSSTVNFCNGRALARANHQRLTMRLGRRHVHRLRHPPSAACGTCTCCCSGPTACSGPSPWEIYSVLSIPFFLITSSANSEQWWCHSIYVCRCDGPY